MVIPQQKWSFSVIFIYNLFVFIPETSNSMTLCEYYSNLGIYKPECHPLYLSHNSIDEEVENEEDESQSQYPQQQQSSMSQYNYNFQQQQQQGAQSSSPFQFSFRHLPSIQFDKSRYRPSSENRYKSAVVRYKSAENEVENILPDYEEYGLCTGFFHMCYESDKCESGTICSQLRTTKQCCTAPGSQCPSPTELGFNCRKINPTSW
uniref:Uncharacterized protein n=1 Tax=Panagrolaimus sp. ES5 TaxID=591445 RepID=A0AC34F4T6_9BILA